MPVSLALVVTVVESVWEVLTLADDDMVHDGEALSDSDVLHVGECDTVALRETVCDSDIDVLVLPEMVTE